MQPLKITTNYDLLDPNARFNFNRALTNTDFRFTVNQAFINGFFPA